MSRFKIILTIYPDPSDRVSADAAFATVGQKFAAVMVNGPSFEGMIVRADIDNENKTNLYIEGNM